MLGTALLNAPVPFWSMAGLVVPPAPNAWSLLTGWEFDPFVIVAAFAGAGYLLGVRRVRERGRRWPAGRTASFLAGVVCIAYAVSGGLAEYDRVLFSAHVAQHLLLGMVGPLLMASGSWVLTERIYHERPQAVTGVMIAAFAFKLVFFGVYVALMLRVVGLRPIPFVGSFTGYVAGLYFMEALYLRRLFR